MRVIVIGINHAGTSMIRTLLAQNRELEVVAYDQNDNISFLGCGIALTISGIVKDPKKLFYSDPDQLEQMGAEIHMNSEVTAIDHKAHTITVKDLKSGKTKQDRYDKLVYAAGSWPISFPAENDDLENIHICKLYQHALGLIEKSEDPSIREVAIIGAGYIGVELVEAFRQKGKNVTLIDLQERTLPNYFDREFTDRLESDLQRHGIRVALGEKVVSYEGEGGRVSAVVTDKGRYPADYVVKCTGFKPNTELLPDATKVANGAIEVNQYMQTSLRDIYAIGDCAAITNGVTGHRSNIALATNAVKSGIVAASNINGLQIVKLESVVGTNAISIFGNNLASTGLSEEAALEEGLDVTSSYLEDNDRPEFMNEYSQVKIKLVFEKQSYRLVGAQIGSYGDASHTEAIFYLALAIQKQMSILDIAFADVYFLPHFNKPFNFVVGAILQALNLNYFRTPLQNP